MEQHAVDAIGMTQQCADSLAVYGGPKFDKIVVASGGDELTVRRDRQAPRPTFMSWNCALGLGLAFLGIPPNQSAITRGGQDCPALVGKPDCEDPAFMAGEGCLVLAIRVPALESLIL